MSSGLIQQLTAALADRYRIERELGQGGMATVYLAQDLRHDRKVAIKVLRPELAAVIGAERFLREIKTIAHLQHPHILGLIDSGEVQGTAYYVMPFVEGESLRDRLGREKQLPIADAVRIASEVASALDYAHRHGVIHRDIKPDNIMLHDGSALVADFGIALAVRAGGGARMTETGMSLGTPHYMSPEQAMGEREITARSDVYALGAMTYEMLLGEPPFTGPTAQAIVAKVMTEKPASLMARRERVPPAIEAAVLTALEKLPADRFGSAAGFVEALTSDAPPRRPVPAAIPSTSRLRDPLVLGLGMGLLAFALLTLFLVTRPGAEPEPFPVRVVIEGSASEERGLGDELTGRAALSPDGHSVAFLGRGSAGNTLIYLRRLDQLTARPLPGTDSPATPVFSPDGKWIAYIAGRRRLMKVPLDGGPVIPLCEIVDNGGLDWTPTGDIILGAGVMENLDGLFRVPPGGSRPEPFTRVDTTRHELSHQWPRVLPDGKTVLFTIWHGSIDQSEIGAASLATGKVTPLGILAARPLGVVGNRLVYVRPDGVAMAVAFDPGRLKASGNPTPVQDSIRIRDGTGGDAFAFLTHAGGLIYAKGEASRRLVWVDRSGRIRPALEEPRDFGFVRLSPDGRRAAVTIGVGASGNLWIYDLAAGTLTPLTTTGFVRNPVWSPDARQILFVSTQGGRSAFWSQPADGSGPAVKLADAPYNPWNIDLAPDGKTVVFNAIYRGSFNLTAFTLDSTHRVLDLATTPALETMGRVAPDGRSVAYISDESGQMEVYLRPFPESGGRIQISLNGGQRPVWSRDGRLYYWEKNRMIVATIARDPAPRVVSRQPWFEEPLGREFDVAPDGSRLLTFEEAGSNVSLVVIPDWVTELRRLTGE